MTQFQRALSKSSFGGKENLRVRKTVTAKQQSDVMRKIAAKTSSTSQKGKFGR